QAEDGIRADLVTGVQTCALPIFARDLARAPVLIVLATTPEPAPPKLAEFRARIGRDLMGAAISLGKLDTAAIRQLIQWALPSYRSEERRVGNECGCEG